VSSRYSPRVDVLLGVALTAAGLYIAHQSASLPKIPAQAYGPGFFPQLVGYALSASGVLMAARALGRSFRSNRGNSSVSGDQTSDDQTSTDRASTDRTNDDRTRIGQLNAGPPNESDRAPADMLEHAGTSNRDGPNWAAIVWVLAGLAGIAWAMNTVGFLIMVPIFLLGYLHLVGEPFLRSLLVVAASTTAAWYGFAVLLRVQIPPGLLELLR
jgi:putative tricarboxylic transport membrane protein